MPEDAPANKPTNQGASQVTKLIRAIILGAAVGVFLTRWHPARATNFHLRISLPMRLSLALWIVFSVYWSIAARKSASTESSESKWSRAFHLVLVNGALLLLILPIPGLTKRFLPDNQVVIAIGLAIQLVFLGLAVWARQHLGDNWAGEVRIAEGHQLIRTGPYRWLRHPIYTAVLGMYVGTGIVSGEIHAPLALILVTVAYIRKLRMEESILTEAFGPDYDAYRQNTWALIPPLY